MRDHAKTYAWSFISLARIARASFPRSFEGGGRCSPFTRENDTMSRKPNYPVLIALVPLALKSVAFADEAPQSGAPAVQTPTERVVVTGSREGEQSYRVPTVDSIGPLGITPVLDTPYSIAILPHDLIENSQAVNFKDVSKYLPLVAFQEQQGPDILRPQTRGMQGGNFQNSKQDGMTMFITGATATEQFEQIEVVNGLSASLYGPANPSGMFNFVTKRPRPTTTCAR